MTIPIVWVDAFTDQPFSGNPAAVCLLESPPDEGWLQYLAAELGLSETAYVLPAADGSFSLRWFTPTTEVDLCGHATLAAAHVLHEAGRSDAGLVRFHTRSGLLEARVGGGAVEIGLPADPATPVPTPPALPAALGLPAGAVTACGRTRTVVLAELADSDTVRGLEPSIEDLGAFGERAVIVTAPAGRRDVDYVLRVFAPNVGIDEDPVTGSAQCVAGPWWAARLGTGELEARQVSRRGGRIRIRVEGDRVHVGGQAVVILRGEVAEG